MRAKANRRADRSTRGCPGSRSGSAGASRYEGGPAAEQDQNDGRRNTHCTIYTLNRLPVASPRQTNNTAALRQGQAPGGQVSALSRWTRRNCLRAGDRRPVPLPRSSRSSTPRLRCCSSSDAEVLIAPSRSCQTPALPAMRASRRLSLCSDCTRLAESRNDRPRLRTRTGEGVGGTHPDSASRKIWV
jgi:hypothetical protein